MPTLYERIGGQPTIANLITLFYKKVFFDPLLGPFFVHTSLEKLTHMQEQFFSIALDGPVPKNNILLRKAHWGRAINQEHLTQFIDHLISTLKEVGIDDIDAQDIVDRINSYSCDILSAPDAMTNADLTSVPRPDDC